MRPQVVTILPTYQCTAACKECCFECTPHVKGRIPRERLMRYIDEAIESVPTLRLLVFSGGECFLLGKDLDDAIAKASAKGLRTRVVTNGYWAVSPEAASKRLQRLKDAGLDELNISSGDDHLEYVPFERVVNGLIAGAELKIVSLVSVEGFENSKFKVEDVFNHPRIRDYLAAHPGSPYLQVFKNVWMPFHQDRELEHRDATYRTPERLGLNGGCTNVLYNMVITPDESLASCCGLTMEHIPEMKLGKLGENPMAKLVDQGMNDFLKRWIWLDGPEAIMAFVHKMDPAVPLPSRNVHPCETCAQFYLNPRAREVVRQHWREVRDDVLLRYELKLQFMQERGGQLPAEALQDKQELTRLSHGDH
ncbi:radical SAM protein [Myxococcus landrumensis]|uniref:Radical SAM core domain-containing protein n=1 Tax=Myxococcus landrumensis TaxID=2813577 RepID=A0ABX7NBB2_9BACT|nr:radical SAM protein [Myxococcus landrumus]QSQ15718.1 hypothetical protein JY572_06535 [Myxococcus landrumus]